MFMWMYEHWTHITFASSFHRFLRLFRVRAIASCLTYSDCVRCFRWLSFQFQFHIAYKILNKNSGSVCCMARQRRWRWQSQHTTERHVVEKANSRCRTSNTIIILLICQSISERWPSWLLVIRVSFLCRSLVWTAFIHFENSIQNKLWCLLSSTHQTRSVAHSKRLSSGGTIWMRKYYVAEFFLSLPKSIYYLCLFFGVFQFIFAKWSRDTKIHRLVF